MLSEGQFCLQRRASKYIFSAKSVHTDVQVEQALQGDQQPTSSQSRIPSTISSSRLQELSSPPNPSYQLNLPV